jgi:hypothetical protein
MVFFLCGSMESISWLATALRKGGLAIAKHNTLRFPLQPDWRTLLPRLIVKMRFLFRSLCLLALPPLRVPLFAPPRRLVATALLCMVDIDLILLQPLYMDQPL